MKIYLGAIIVGSVLFCILGMFGANFVLAQETKDVSANGDGAFTAPFLIRAGTRFNLTFDSISIRGQISITGTGFSQSLSSSSGTISGGPFQVKLEPGTYTLTETYSGSGSSSNELIGKPSIQIPEVTFTRTISVPNSANYTITVNTTYRNLKARVGGPFTGSGDISGVVGNSIALVLVSTKDFQQNEVINFSAGFTVTVASNTAIEAKSDPPTVTTVGIEVEGGGPALVTSTLKASATGSDPEDGPLQPSAFSYQWLKNGSLIPGATGTTLKGQFKKGDKIAVQAIATDSGSKQSPPKVSGEVTIQNSPPAPPTVNFPAGPFTTLNTLTPTITPGTDLDGDAVVVRISWLFNGTKQNNLEGKSTAGPGIPKGTKVKVEAVSNDGTLDSTPASVEITIANLAPVVGEIGQKQGREREKFSIPIPGTDADKDVIKKVTPTITKTTANVPTGQPQPSIDGLSVDANLNLMGTPKDIPRDGATFTISLIANDGEADSAPRAFNLVVQNANLPPVIDPLSPVTVKVPLDGSSVPVNVLVSAIDLDGEPVSFQASSSDRAVQDAIKAFNANTTPNKRTLTFAFKQTDLEQKDNQFVGRVISISLFANDGNPGGVAEAALWISLQFGDVPLNFPPTLAIPNETLIQINDPQKDVFEKDFAPLAKDPDAQGAPQLTFSIVPGTTLPSGATLASNGRFKWEFSKVKPGVYVLGIQVTDTDPLPNRQPPQPQTAKQLVTYTLNNPPDPPTINVSNQTIEEGKTLTFKTTASDPDLTTVAFSAIGIPPWLTFNPATFAFDPTQTNNISSQTATGTVPFDVSLGPDVIIEVTFTATDPTGLPTSKMAKITVKNTNRPPKFNPVAPATVREGQVLKLPFKAIDPDNDKLTYTKTGGLGSFDAATLIYTLDLTNKFDVAQEGKTDEDKASIEADDGLGGKDQIQVPIDVVNVNRPPVIAAIGNQTIPENPEQPSDIAIDATDPDLPPGQSLPKGNFSVSAIPALPFKAEFVDGNVKLQLTPGFEDAGIYNVTVRVTDGDKLDPKTASQSFRLNVTNTNRPPAGTIADQETSVGDTFVAELSNGIQDLDGDDFTFELISGPTGLDVSPNGHLVWLVPGDQPAGEVTVKVKIKDQPAEGEPGELEIEFKIEVKRPNLPPVMGRIKRKQVQEGATLTLPLTASDLDGDAIIFVLGQGTVGAIQGATYTFTPDASQVGKQFQVFITAVDVDGNGDPILHLDQDGNPIIDPLSIASFVITVGDVVPSTIKEIVDIEVKEGDTLELTFELENPPAGGVDWAFAIGGPAGRPSASLTPADDKKSAKINWQPGFVGRDLDNNLDQAYILTVVGTDTASGLFDDEKIGIVVGNVNRPPQFDAAPSIVLDNKGLMLNVKASDPDNNRITLTILWQKKGVNDANFVGVTAFNNTPQVPRQAIKPNEEWQAKVTANDRHGGTSGEEVTPIVSIPDTPAVLQVTVSGGKDSRDPVTILATYEDPDLTPPVDNVNLHIENGTGFIWDKSLPKESGGNPLVGSYHFTGVFPRGTFNYTVSATGAKEDKKGSFTIVNTGPRLIFGDLSRPVTGSVPINFALLDIDDDLLSVSVTLDQGVPTLSRAISPAEANQVIAVNWDSVTDLPNATGRTERTLTISVSDGAGGFDSKSLKITVFNKGGVPTPKLNPLPPPLPIQVDIQGIKQLRSNEAIDYGVELIINGQKTGQLPPDSNNPFTFANVTLAGKNSIQTNLFALIRYTANVVESVLRQSTPDVTGKLRYSLTYQTSPRSFEVRHTGPSSDAIEAIVDDKPPELSIISPDEVVSTNAPTLMANIKDANLDRASIKFELDGRSITPTFNPETGLAQFTPTTTNPFAAGPHKFKASAKDFSNNPASAEKEFTINPVAEDKKPPVWTSLSPNDGGRVRTRQTSIVAGVSDAQSPLNPGSVVVEVNGKPVPKDQVSFSAIDPRTGQISFTATADKDGIVQVRVSIADNPGADKPSNLGTCSWSYEVDTIGPVAPTLVAVDCTGDEVTTITGIAEPGSTVKLIRNGAFYTEVIADLASGAYGFLNVPLVIGENTFLAIPLDALGNVGTPSALGKTIRDEVPPTISIFSPVPNQILATQTPSVSASLRDNCEVDESSITLDVQVNGGDVVPVTNFDYNKVTGVLSFTLPKLPDGSVFTLTVGASDTAGNAGESSVTAQINTAITDTQPPTIANVRLDGQSVPSGSTITTRANQPAISASVIDTDSGVENVAIIVNGASLNTSYDKATSTATAQPDAPQADGRYNVEIRATDKNNNTASFFFSFEVRTAVPKPGIALDPAVERTKASSIGVIASNITPDSQVTWLVNGIPIFSRTFGVGEDSFRREVALEPGMNKIAIEVRDVVGNTGMSDVLTVERDVQAPEIFLVNPINGSKVKGDADISVKLLFRDASGIDESSIRIQITQIDPDTGAELEVVTQQNRLVALAPSQVGPNTEFEASRTIPNHGPDREDTYRVKALAKDAVGNEPSQAFVASFTIDSKAPDVNILVPTSNGEVIPNSIPQLSGEIDPSDVLVSSIAVTLDGAPVAHLYNSASGQVTVEPKEFASDPNTSHALTIKAADLVGNERSVSRSFIIDTSQEDQVNPVLSGFFPLPDSTISSTSLAILSFIAADGGGINPDLIFLTINGKTVQLSKILGAVQQDRGRFIIFLDRLSVQQVVSRSGPFQLDPLELSALEDPLEIGALESPIGSGRNTVSVQVSDLAGNLSVAEWSFNVVTEPPDVPVLDALVTTTAQGEISVSGRVPDAPLGTTVTIFANDVVAQKLRVKADSTFTAERVLLVAGVNKISALASDIAGLTSTRSETQAIFLDTEPPRVTINALPAIVRDASLTVTGTVTDNSTAAFKSISIIVNKEAARDLGKDTRFSADVTLLPGDNTIQIEAVDAVGNTGSGSVTVKLNTEVPTTAPTDLAGVVNSAGNGIRLTWKADKNASTYNIYRSNAEITQIGALQPTQRGVVGTEFVDVSIVGVTAYYAVTSVNSAGGEGKVVSNSPNVALITSNGGVAAISDGTKVVFGRDALFKNSSLSASVAIGVVDDTSSPPASLPAAIPNSIRSISVTGQSGTSVETFNKSAPLTLAYPESIKDSADSPRIFELISGKWEKVENQVVDIANNTVSAQVTRPGVYRLGEIQLHPWDVNGDGKVNIFDLVIVGGQFGKTPPDNPAADVNGDGTVNIFDLVLVGSHFGEIFGSTAAAPVALNRTSASDVEMRMVAEVEKSAPALGDLVTIRVEANSAVKLGGVQFDLRFDTQRLSIVEATKGGWFESQGSQSYWLPPKVADGRLTLASAAIGAPGLSPSQELASVFAQISFRVKGDVNAAMESIRMENVQVADLDGRAILANWRNRVDITALTKRSFQNALLQNYPNPFNPETWMPYTLAEDAHVIITIYNVLGQPVRRINLGFVPAGEYTSKERASYWDGRNERGEPVASGMYFYTIQAGKFVASKKLVVLK